MLVEYQAPAASELAELSHRAEALFGRLPLTAAPVLSQDEMARASLWRIRKGLYATIAGSRPSGTTALLEDIAVPVAALSETCAGLTRLFKIHGYDDAVIFGHAKDGNVHFLINENFDEESNLARYAAFTEDMVELVLGAGGTLKAEHGTGRIMAPYVARQYGPVLYGIMLDIKKAFDPAGILNPDAVLTTDPDLHLKDLKSTPTLEAEVDRCVECGYCEPVCPSKDLTTTPRQRIVVQRAIAEAEQRGDTALAKELRHEQEYEVVETCAVDGMCQTACPVLINTGDLVRRLRSEKVGAVEAAAWTAAGKAWRPVTQAASAALTLAAAVPASLITGPNSAARALLGADTLPLWSKDLPKGGSIRRSGSDTNVGAVYFQACVGTMFGPAEGGEGVAAAFESLAVKAGIGLLRPDAIGGLCCGTPWKSRESSADTTAWLSAPLPPCGRHRITAGFQSSATTPRVPRAWCLRSKRRSVKTRIIAPCASSTPSISPPSTSCPFSRSARSFTASPCTQPARVRAPDPTRTSRSSPRPWHQK
ncbi:FAD-binding and (Fe-S)-binding domain-containing protein [Arthrobacter sp. SA17]